MALAAVQTAMNLEEKKTIHPFFSKPQRDNSPDRISSADQVPSGASHDDALWRSDSDAQSMKPHQKRPRKSDEVRANQGAGAHPKNQPSLERYARRPNTQSATEGALHNVPGAPEKPPSEEEFTQHRRKRRKTGSPESYPVLTAENEISYTAGPPNWHHQLQVQAGKDEPGRTEMAENSTTSAISRSAMTILPPQSADALPRSITPPATCANVALILDDHPVEPTMSFQSDAKNNYSKEKVIKINKSGKLLSSPPDPEPAKADGPKRRRGRKRMGAKASTKVIIIKYGSDAASRQFIGQKIDDIFNGNQQASRQSAPSNVAPKSDPVPKTTHPFFLGKPIQKTEMPIVKSVEEVHHPSSAKNQVKSAVTPGKLRADSRYHRIAQPPQVSGPIFGSNRTPKYSGLDEAPWPSRETVHVRNLGHLDVARPQLATTAGSYICKPRKLKSSIIAVPTDEDLIEKLGQQIRSCLSINDDHVDSDFQPREDVRLPNRLLTSGPCMQEQVRREVKSTLHIPGESSSITTGAHPAIQALYNDIENTLTPFDQGKCELQSWTQKYAPQCASHTLLPGKEAIVLRDYLKSFIVMAVEGTKDVTKASSIPVMKKPPKKKRKKAEDDFIVFEDDIDDEFIEVSDGESFDRSYWGAPRERSLQRSRVSRDKNVIILSGPNGCGKSATVYAVAKELGFEVFEINSGSRRSGKDILDKVGDMSENHLVNHRRDDALAKKEAPLGEDTDGERMTQALQQDIANGRQGTMTAFFKANAQPSVKQKVAPKAYRPHMSTISAQASLPGAPSQRTSQKQSLILFEEADVLFEEDQQFWSQVSKLASQSKRPIIVTCNSESLIPVYDLPIGAILRLSPPSIDVATDYLLVLAAREGHLLKRKVVAELYQSKKCDLRASLTELNLWCQMSVGDRKGGLEWIYQRWPPGNDVDEHGQPLRVASEGTYQSSMGWLSHNIFMSQDNVGFQKQEELVKDVWKNWGIKPSQWATEQPPQGSLTRLPNINGTRLEDLERLDAICESISATETYSRIGMPDYERHYDEPIDPSLPPLSEKERLNYTTSAPVMQADHVTDFASFDTNIYVQSHLQIRRAFGSLIDVEFDRCYNLLTSENDLGHAILQQKTTEHSRPPLGRSGFSEAFDILAVPPTTIPTLSNTYPLTASSFDRTFRIVVEDLAPYIRSIVAYDQLLEAQRIRLGNLLSEGGRSKRPRATRASRTAVEGGNRESKRRDWWFDKDLNFEQVMATAGKSWTGLGSGVEDMEMTSITSNCLSGHMD